MFLLTRFVSTKIADPSQRSSQRWFSWTSLRVWLFALIAATNAVQGATITVTSAGDSVSADGAVTLREAISSINAGANVNADVVAVGAYGSNDAIQFNIPGAGLQSIIVGSALTITKPTKVLGYTQPGSSANTNTVASRLGSNAVLSIEIDHGLNVFAITGGGSALSGLLVSGSSGVQLSGGGGNSIAGCFFGTNATGSAAGAGVPFSSAAILIAADSPNNTIGGSTADSRNVISNGSSLSANSFGVSVFSSGNRIQGNMVGTNAAGSNAISLQLGIVINSGANNVIADNLVSGNRTQGVQLNGNNSVVTGNFVGTNISGSAAIPNLNFGIAASGSGNIIGGAVSGQGNLVSGNTNVGIAIANGSSGNNIWGNIVGADVSGVTAIGGHLTAGIQIDYPSNAVGDTSVAGAGNIVAFNFGDGVHIGCCTGNIISRNSIFSNSGLGIKLGAAAGFLPNDVGDGDTGANSLQNYPVLTSAAISGGTLTLSGALNSVASSNFRLEFFSSPQCHASNHGEGRTYLGFASVSTDASGNVSFGPLTFTPPSGEAAITATATDSVGSTSEFSACVVASTVVIPQPLISINSVSANEGNVGTTPFTFTVTLNAASGSTVTVNYATADGTATAGADYIATSGTLNFAPGVTSQTVTVLVNGDLAVEPNETFFVNLTSPTNATLATAQGVATILNDDSVTQAPPANVVPVPTLRPSGLVLLIVCLGLFTLVITRRARSAL